MGTLQQQCRGVCMGNTQVKSEACNTIVLQDTSAWKLATCSICMYVRRVVVMIAVSDIVCAHCQPNTRVLWVHTKGWTTYTTCTWCMQERCSSATTDVIGQMIIWGAQMGGLVKVGSYLRSWVVNPKQGELVLNQNAGSYLRQWLVGSCLECGWLFKRDAWILLMAWRESHNQSDKW